MDACERLTVSHCQWTISVRDGAEFKNKLMEVMVYFYPAKNKHQSVLQLVNMDNYDQTLVIYYKQLTTIFFYRHNYAIIALYILERLSA
jgi:hypothetical protein